MSSTSPSLVPTATGAENSKEGPTEPQFFTHDFRILPIPRRLQYNPDSPFHFGLALNIFFGITSTCVVANLYYCQPLLIEFSKSFGVSYEEVSIIPTMVQAGYAVGLVLISPLGDLVRRRQLILFLIIVSGSLTIGLAVTSNLRVFSALTFLIGMFSVTPQILLPLAADLAPPETRAAAVSVVLSGLMLGVLVARVMAGLIAQFTTWRVVYYVSIGLQAMIVVGCWLVIPDYPSKNNDLSYFQILWSMAKFAVTEPVLIQAALINIAGSACFSSFWVTLTFLLGGEPYNYNTLAIGLFGLIGIAGVACGPFTGKLIDRFVPWYATLFSLFWSIVAQSVQTGAGGISIAAVVISTFGLDLARQMQQVSLSVGVFAISAPARARLNAIMILSIFIGQVAGTPVGTVVFVRYGWRASAALSLALMGFQVLVLLARGPHCERYTWFGYEGGWNARKAVDVQEKTERLEEKDETVKEAKDETVKEAKDA